MEAPVCALCGQRHWALCRAEIEAIAGVGHAPPRPAVSVADAKPDRTAERHQKRIAYQRAYYRRRRAKAASETPTGES